MKGRLTGYHVLFILLGFFGIMIAVNVVFTVFAVKSFPGEQVERSYVQGLNYNQVLEDREQQAELGWTTELGFEASETGDALLVNNWYSETGEGLAALDVTVTLTRPASEEGQLRLTLSPNGPGRYEAGIENLAGGVWHAEISASSTDGASATAHKTLTWTL